MSVNTKEYGLSWYSYTDDAFSEDPCEVKVIMKWDGSSTTDVAKRVDIAIDTPTTGPVLISNMDIRDFDTVIHAMRRALINVRWPERYLQGEDW